MLVIIVLIVLRMRSRHGMGDGISGERWETAVVLIVATMAEKMMLVLIHG